MAQPIWSGVLTFGLVTVPVGVYSAVDEHTIHFHQIQRSTTDRVRIRRVNERTGQDVKNEDIVKGYELKEGRYVIVEPEELNEIAPGRSQTIDVSGFVDLGEVELVYFATTYYLAPRGAEYRKVYDLLRQAMERTNRAGIATFTMRGKQYLTAVRAEAKVMVLHLLHWADEVRDPSKELPNLPQRKGGRGKELESAVELIDALAIDWKPEQYRDTYHEHVKELVQAKAEGQQIEPAPAPPEATNIVDLMEALQSSIDQARMQGEGARTPQGRKQAPTRKAATGKPAAGKKAAAKARPARAGTGRSRGRQAGGKTSSDLAGLTKAELYQRATKAGITGRSTMSREDLIKALTGHKRSKTA
ncbi:Ku protein [Streptomyces triculaminicus]|uniref:non-homologous end joining protein Ku n=1 Tax=Streptomyces triculaminicus TaxID=2816232 RepID=UPI0033F3263A